MELVLARHAQTAANEQRQFCGRLNPPLSPQGDLEARRTALALGGHFDIVLTSGMLRTQQMAAILAPYARADDWEALREVDFGEFEGRTAQEIEHSMPQEWDRYMTDPLHFTFPNGDHAQEYFSRVEAAVQKIVRIDAQHVLVASHKGWIAAALSVLLHGNTSHMFHYDIRPAGFARISVADGFAVLKQLY